MILHYRHVDVFYVQQQRQVQAAMQLIDVREAHEYARAHIAGAVLCPLSQAATWIEQLDRESELIIMCHHGVRSEHVAEALVTRFGYTNVATMDGGIDDWSCRIDPSVPRY